MSILAEVVSGTLGTVICCDPSLGVLAANTVGKVTPPSVENLILTFWQLMVALLVLPTFQVTVCLLFAPQAGGVFTVNAGTSSTVTVIKSDEVLPATGASSLTVNRTFIVLPTDGVTSQVV